MGQRHSPTPSGRELTLTVSEPERMHAIGRADRVVSRLSVTYNKLGDLAVKEGQGDRARELFQPGLEIRVRLAAGEPDNTGYQRDLSVSYDKLGDLAVAEGQGERARELFQQGLEIAVRLATAGPGNTNYQRDLTVF